MKHKHLKKYIKNIKVYMVNKNYQKFMGKLLLDKLKDKSYWKGRNYSYKFYKMLKKYKLNIEKRKVKILK